MLGLWADYVGYPGGAALRAAGFTGVVRYVGIGGAGKRLTAAEYADLTAHGLQVLAVVESTTTEADAGYNAGVNDARAALADLAQLGADAVPFIFATNDKSTFTTNDVDYVRGFRDVLGAGRTGAYGFSDFLTAVKGLNFASVFWQAGHPPSLTGTGDFVHFWQRQGTPGAASDGPATPTTVTVGGVSVDLDNQLLALPGGNMAELDDIYDQLAGPGAADGQYPGWPSQRYGTTADGAATKHTLTDYVVGVDRELNSRLAASARNALAARLDMDTVFGHVVSTHAVAEQILTAVTALAGAVSADQAALLAAIQGVSQPTVSDAQLAELETQLAAALPQYTVSIAPKAAGS